jgi:hypothetical protein
MSPTVRLANAKAFVTASVIRAADIGDAMVWREVYCASISHSHRPSQERLCAAPGKRGSAWRVEELEDSNLCVLANAAKLVGAPLICAADMG